MEIVKLAYEAFGSGNAAPLIILHGFFASSRNWRRVAERLSLSYHVFVPDLRNHGSSPHHPVMDYPSMAADILSFMDEHGLDNAHILGHSMGGKCAMWLALNHPQRLRKLVVVDIAPKAYTHSFDSLIQSLSVLPLPDIKNRKEAESMLAESIPEPGYRQFLLQNLILVDGVYSWRINLAIFKAMAPNIVAFPEINNLNPYEKAALFIGGEHSSYVEKKDISDLFPSAILKKVTNAGHWVHVQNPGVFLEMVENFLQ